MKSKSIPHVSTSLPKFTFSAHLAKVTDNPHQLFCPPYQSALKSALLLTLVLFAAISSCPGEVELNSEAIRQAISSAPAVAAPSPAPPIYLKAGSGYLTETV